MKVFARFFDHIILYLCTGNCLMAESGIQTPQYFPEFLIIIHHLPYRVQHISAFVVHISTAFFIYAIKPDNGYIIADVLSFSHRIIIGGCFAIIVFGKQHFAVIRKAFVNPHIGNIFCRNIIAKPFMPTFMYDNKIPFFTPARAGAVHATIAILVSVAISHSALMFHAKMRSFYQLVAIFIKRVRTKPILKGLHHFRGLCKMRFCFLQVLGKHPVIHI